MNTTCFVIMPYRPELSYTYRFIKEHLANSFDVHCERADDRILTIPLLDKIREMIADADFVVADVSGRNPNVFYELGMAHVTDKPVILITHDDIDEAPTDIKAYEFIRYTSDHDAFASKLDTAVRGIIGGDYDDLYEAARQVFVRFREASGRPLAERSKAEFFAAAFHGIRVSELPDPEDARAVARTLGFSMVAPPIDVDTAGEFAAWVNREFPRPA